MDINFNPNNFIKKNYYKKESGSCNMKKDKQEKPPNERFKDLQDEIEARKKSGLPVDHLLREQLQILANFYKEFVDITEHGDTDYSKNRNKYQMQLSYLDAIKIIKTQLKEPVNDIEQEEKRVKTHISEIFGYPPDFLD